MTASMQFTPGDIIQDFEEPFVKNLYVSCKKRHCNCCFKRNINLRKCSGCKKVLYCDSKCQKIDWKTAHAIECKLFANPQILQILIEGWENIVFQVIRLMAFLKLHKASATKSFHLYDGSQRCFNDLQDNYDEVIKNRKTTEILSALATKLNDSKLFSTLECTYENVVRMHGVWKTNAFGALNEEQNKTIGTVLYVMSSSFDHSCRPNALRVTGDSYRMQIRCIEAIPAGESPKITYLAGSRSRECRQQTLMESFYFSCECVLCETEKVAPLVNYEELLRVRASFDRTTIYGNDQLLVAKNILKELEKIFCKYDERITNLYDYTLEKLVITLQGPNAFMVSVPQVNEFAKQVEENLQITFGIDHKNYKYFVEEIASRLRKVSC